MDAIIEILKQPEVIGVICFVLLVGAVPILRKYAKQTKTKVDDQLVDALEDALKRKAGAVKKDAKD